MSGALATAVAALAAAGAAAVLAGGRGWPPGLVAGPVPGLVPGPDGGRGDGAGRAVARGSAWGSPLARRGAFGLAALVVLLGVGGVLGLGLAIGIVAVGPRLVGRLESRGVRDRREALARQSGDCADLLAACLASGAPVPAATAAVARAIGPPADAPLARLVAALDLGADPAVAWAELGTEPGLAPLAAAVARSLETGAPLGDVLPGIADDLRRESRARAESAARAAGVRAVGPLAACFLPAFLLIGIVPVIVSLALPVLAPR